MPLYSYRKISDTVFLGVWKIVETPDCFLNEINLSEAELEKYSMYKSESRKSQWLSCRMMLKMYMKDNAFEESILYDENGKPYFASGKFISISHTPQYSTIIISEKKIVGIDIERVTERILKIKSKFVSDQEMHLMNEENAENLTTIWAAKEAVYKLFGIFDLNFKNDIYISVPIDKKDFFDGKVNHALVKKVIELRRIFIEDHVLVYIID